jgi:RND family efflux transporter MFP subunit
MTQSDHLGHVKKASLFLLTAFVLASCSHEGSSEKKAANVENHERSHETGKLPTVAVVKVRKQKLERILNLPGEMRAYQDVPIHAKVEGFIKSIIVDRGSFVKKGQLLLSIFCPELNEKMKEAAAKVAAAESSYRRAQAGEDSVKSKLVEAQARLDADLLTYQRLAEASKTPGAVAQNEVDIQQKTVESDRARVESVRQEVAGAQSLVVAEMHNVKAAQEVLGSLKDMTGYLTVCAPFDGVITERNVHVGSIVAENGQRDALPLVRIQERDILRLVVAVPEDAVSGTQLGQKIEFTVPAYLGKKFYGIIARPAYALDEPTRTEPVEMNVYNTNRELDPGMFANVAWIVSRPYPTLFVPASAVNSDLKSTFVIRVKDDVTERVDVKRGLSMGEDMEVIGDLQEGETVALKATDELKTGTRLITKVASAEDIEKASHRGSAGGE